MRNQVSDQASSWQHLMQRSFNGEEWNANIRINLIGQPIDYEHGDDSYVLSGGLMLEGCHSTSGEPESVIRHITDDGVGIVWLPFDAALQVFDQIQIRISAWPCHPRLPRCSPQQFLGILSVRRAWPHRAWTWLVLQWVVVNVWHSLSVEDLFKIPPSVHDCPGSRPMVVCKYGKETTIPWWKLLRRHILISLLDTGKMERLKGTLFDALGVRLIKGLPGEDASYCPFGDIKDSTNGCSFHTRHRSP